MYQSHGKLVQQPEHLHASLRQRKCKVFLLPHYSLTATLVTAISLTIFCDRMELHFPSY